MSNHPSFGLEKMASEYKAAEEKAKWSRRAYAYSYGGALLSWVSLPLPNPVCWIPICAGVALILVGGAIGLTKAS